MCKPLSKLAHKGNSLPEYLLIAAFILVLSLTGFANLGKNLGNWLSLLRGDMSQHITSAQNASAMAAAEAAMIPGAGSSPGGGGAAAASSGSTTACINEKN